MGVVERFLLFLQLVIDKNQVNMNYILKAVLVLLVLSVSPNLWAQSTKWRDIHKVKRHETIFGIARSYDLTIEELLDANPEMKEKGYELKKGSEIFIPYSKTSTTQPTPAKPSKPTTTAKGIDVVKVGIMLPFLDNSTEGKRMIEYYRGVRAALDSLGHMGIKTQVNLWNLNKDSVVTNVLKHNPQIANQDVIFGPLYTNQVHPLADFCHKHGARLVIPFSTTATDVNSNPNIFQIYQDEDELSARSRGAFVERFSHSHRPIFINCNNPSDGKYTFTRSLREYLGSKNIQAEITDINTPLREFAKHFSQTQPNVVILNSAAYKPLERVFEKLDSLKNIDPSLIISTYGYNEWFIYQPYLEKDYFKYNVHIPTTFYYSRKSARTEAFEKLFEKDYGQKMNPDGLPRMGIMGFDHTMYFVLGLSHYGEKYVGNEQQNSEYKPLQTRLEFKKLKDGGYQNNNFQVIRFKTDGSVDSLTY